MTPRWLYQAKAEPLNRGPETPTPDKWIPVYPDRHMVRKPALLEAIIAGAFFAPPDMSGSLWVVSTLQGSITYTQRFQYQALAEPFKAAWLPPVAEEATVDKWMPPLSQPVRQPLKLVQEGWSVACAVETPELYQWLQPLSQPVYPRQRSFWEGVWSFGMDKWAIAPSEVIGVDKWYVPTSEPVRQERRLVTEGWTVADPHQYSRPISEWGQPLSEPVLPLRRTREGWSQPESVDPTLISPEAVTVDKWFVRSPDPRWGREHREYLYPSWSGEDLFQVPTLDPARDNVSKWYQPTSTPVWRRPVLVAEGWVCVDPLPVNWKLTDWFVEMSQPVRPLERVREGWSEPEWLQPVLPVYAFNPIWAAGNNTVVQDMRETRC